MAVAALALASCARGRGQVEILDASSDGSTVDMTVASCNGSPSAKVVESPETVVITVTAESSDDDCADGITVRLSDPLDSRRLMDGSNDEPVMLTAAPLQLL